MSERQIKLTWGTAKAQAEDETVFIFPEGTTDFEVDPSIMPEKNDRFKGKYLIRAQVYGKQRTLSLSSKQFLIVAENLEKKKTKFRLTRIGLSMQDTRYKLEVL